MPSPADNPTTAAKAALGARLFADPRLSGQNGVACSTCHQPELSFSDGIARRVGLAGETLARRTQPLWNVAWALTLFWDGRARSLEDQAAFPVENRHEMGGSLGESARELAADPALRSEFARVFPGEPDPVTPATIAKALAAFERTLVSPPTRFDAWVAGDEGALSPNEIAGLRLFTGKAGCATCHSGWRFTDEAFHDIGLPQAAPPDPGRGAVLRLQAGAGAFKTPSLRERVWTGPYMHDGSLETLADAVAHYGGGRAERRATLSRDLDPDLVLTATEQAGLVAFLETLSSQDPPRPTSLPSRVQVSSGGQDAPVSVMTIGQKDRRFTPAAVTIRAGDALTIVNDDTRTHTVGIADPRMPFTSEAQEPGDRVVVPFGQAGDYDVVCGIHPDMRLRVRVENR